MRGEGDQHPTGQLPQAAVHPTHLLPFTASSSCTPHPPAAFHCLKQLCPPPTCLFTASSSCTRHPPAAYSQSLGPRPQCPGVACMACWSPAGPAPQTAGHLGQSAAGWHHAADPPCRQCHPGCRAGQGRARQGGGMRRGQGGQQGECGGIWWICDVRCVM